MNLYEFNVKNKNIYFHCKFYILFIRNKKKDKPNKYLFSIIFMPMATHVARWTLILFHY